MTARRCPYFAEIVERQHRNPRFSWRLFAAGPARERWRQAQAWMRTGMPGGTLLPSGTDPLAVRWPSGSAIVDVSDQPGALVQRLAQAMIRDGVEHAVLVDMRTPSRTVHVKVAPAPQQVAA